MILLLLLGCIVGVFAVVLLKGAPYLPVRRKERQLALELLGLRPGDTVVDLGSGDGAFLLAAAKAGLVAYGYELNPILCLVSKVRCWKYRQQVHIYWGDFWKVDFPAETKGVYVFLLDRFMEQLGKKLEQQSQKLGAPLTVVSYTFQIPGHKPHAQKGALFRYDFY